MDKADSLENKGKLDDSVYFRSEAIQWLKRIGVKDEAYQQTEKIINSYMKIAKGLEAEGENGKAGVYYKKAFDYLTLSREPNPELVDLLKNKARVLATDALKSKDLGKGERLSLNYLVSDLTDDRDDGINNLKSGYNQEKTLLNGVQRGYFMAGLVGSKTFTQAGVNDISAEVSEAKLVAMVEEHKIMAEKELVHNDYVAAAGHFISASRALLNRGMKKEADPLLSLALESLENGIKRIASNRKQFYEKVKLLRHLISVYRMKGDTVSVKAVTDRLMKVYEDECNYNLERKRFYMAKLQAENAIKALKEEDPDVNVASIIDLLNAAKLAQDSVGR
jgi:hypothetical protein